MTQELPFYVFLDRIPIRQSKFLEFISSFATRNAILKCKVMLTQTHKFIKSLLSIIIFLAVIV